MRNIYIYVLFFISFTLFGQENLSYSGSHKYLNFVDNRVIVYELDIETLEPQETRVEYEIVYENRIPFLELKEPINERWLFLYSRYFAFVYRNSNDPFFEGIGAEKHVDNIRNGDYETSSFLKEKDVEYKAENLSANEPFLPWAEGVSGDGVGETIDIEWQHWNNRDGSRGGIGAMIIINGFISYDKPYLFEKNNRVKEIKVVDSEGRFSFIQEIEDTPNPQVVFFPEVPKKVRIEILSVYKGSTWNDTCINTIVGLEEQQAQKLKEQMRITNIK